MSAPETETVEMPRIAPEIKPKRTIHPGMWALIALAFILSVARLTMRGLESGAFDDASILGVGFITPLLLAFLFALVTDVAIFEAIAIIVRNPRNWAAWVMLLLFASMTVYYQAHGPEPWMVMATAPVAMVLVVVARHLWPALEETRARQEMARRWREQAARQPHGPVLYREPSPPERDTSPPVTINQTFHTTAASRADAASVTTSPHHEESGEEAEEGHPAATPARREVAPDILTATPHHREITAPAYASVEEAWEVITSEAEVRGGRLGWRAIQGLTGLSEHKSKQAARRLTGHLTVQET